MNTVSEVMTELKKIGNAQTRRVFANHGAPENTFGCKLGDLKVVARKIRGNHELALELYESGNSDAMYLAGLVADGTRMTKAQLNKWVRMASWYFLAEYAVPNVAHASKHARDLAIKWMANKKETIATSGWTTYSAIVATRPDEELDLDQIEQLLGTIENTIHQSHNRVRYVMNGFVIAVGSYIKPLNKRAKAVAKSVGKVTVNMGATGCKVPDAAGYIKKMEARKAIGKKRSSIR